MCAGGGADHKPHGADRGTRTCTPGSQEQMQMRRDCPPEECITGVGNTEMTLNLLFKEEDRSLK